MRIDTQGRNRSEDGTRLSTTTTTTATITTPIRPTPHAYTFTLTALPCSSAIPAAFRRCDDGPCLRGCVCVGRGDKGPSVRRAKSIGRRHWNAAVWRVGVGIRGRATQRPGDNTRPSSGRLRRRSSSASSSASLTRKLASRGSSMRLRDANARSIPKRKASNVEGPWSGRQIRKGQCCACCLRCLALACLPGGGPIWLGRNKEANASPEVDVDGTIHTHKHTLNRRSKPTHNSPQHTQTAMTVEAAVPAAADFPHQGILPKEVSLGLRWRRPAPCFPMHPPPIFDYSLRSHSWWTGLTRTRTCTHHTTPHHTGDAGGGAAGGAPAARRAGRADRHPRHGRGPRRPRAAGDARREAQARGAWVCGVRSKIALPCVRVCDNR